MPVESASGPHSLVPHPSAEAGAIRELSATLTLDLNRLTLNYRLLGDLSALRFPPPRPPVRADGLWRHTCFEAFFKRGAGSDYREYNFSPSGAWAAYHFSAYREGMKPLGDDAAPVITQKKAAGCLEVSVLLDLAWLRGSSATGARLGLAAVVEDRTGALTYWALAHPPGTADFHHADGFVVTLA